MLATPSGPPLPRSASAMARRFTITVCSLISVLLTAQCRQPNKIDALEAVALVTTERRQRGHTDLSLNGQCQSFRSTKRPHVPLLERTMPEFSQHGHLGALTAKRPPIERRTHQRETPNSFSMSAIIGCVKPALRNSSKSSAM